MKSISMRSTLLSCEAAPGNWKSYTSNGTEENDAGDDRSIAAGAGWKW